MLTRFLLVVNGLSRQTLSRCISALRKRIGFLGACGIAILVARHAIGEVTETALAKLRSAIQSSRNEIRSMEASYQIRRKVHEGGILPKSMEYEGTVHVWLDRDRLRGDRIIDASRDYRRIYCFNCYDGDRFVNFSTEPLAQGKRAISIRDAKYTTVTDLVINPRYVGLVPSTMESSPQFPVENVFATNDRNSIKVEQVLLGEHSFQLISWDAINPPTHFRCWLPEDSSLRISRIEQEWRQGKQVIVETLTMEYESLDSGHVVYPSRVKFEQRYDNTLVMSEEMTATVISINKPISESVFSISGMPGAVAGTPVQWVSDAPPPASGALVWDGQSVIGWPFSE